MKSSIVQKLEKYLANPKASHFRNISIVKITQNPKLVQYKILFNDLFFSKCMSSKQRVMLEANIKTKINHSNAGVSTYCSTKVRRPVHLFPQLVLTNESQQLHLKIMFYVNKKKIVENKTKA